MKRLEVANELKKLSVRGGKWEHVETLGVDSRPQRRRASPLLTLAPKNPNLAPDVALASNGLAPGMVLVAINTHRFSPDALRSALRAARTTSAPIELLVSYQDDILTFRLNYHDGERYPHLERDTATKDMFNSILAPLSHQK
jgi:hypothetical protein